MTEHGKLTWEGLPFPKYESPIEVEIIPPDMFTQEIIEQTENGIMAKVRYELQVNVNKEELIKALDYDRNQYEKGYKDALEDMGFLGITGSAENIFKTEKDEHIEFKCSKCGATAGEVRGGTLDGARFKYCPNCGRILYQ